MALCIEGRIALISFTSFAILAFYQLNIFYGDYWSYTYCLITFFSAVICTFFLPYHSVVQPSALLGTVFGTSILLLPIVSCTWRWFWLYMLFLSIFHFSEYIVTAVYNSHRLNFDSFLLNHSIEYQSAAIASWIEFIIEAYLFPQYKCFRILNYIGLFLVSGGELLRKIAMITAKSNFSHIVQSEKADSHQLVTDGIYAWTRHPSYVGWFYWSIGTQIMLCNPLCTVAYGIASWKFFDERVRDEEYHLLTFFGGSYVDYMLKVPTRLPYIYGLENEVKHLRKKESPETKKQN